ncbi:hypothetical protein LNP18_06275 [Leuconostoc citreum]|uniref:hypothetical protein n=1 Tax=Leuconostoc citreum TaxID=33964 RepID=UPI00200B43F0|nr:hypothetical protein [Leuconostoc citreum]MCK8605709.1 hypothetical protein [Leuconostoc citreum]
METTVKTIRGIDVQTIQLIESRADKLGVSSNELIRNALDDYARRIQEVEASETLHAYIDDLIEANNNLVASQNQNTLILGEIAKTIIERINYYLPAQDMKTAHGKNNTQATNDNSFQDENYFDVEH